MCDIHFTEVHVSYNCSVLVEEGVRIGLRSPGGEEPSLIPHGGRGHSRTRRHCPMGRSVGGLHPQDSLRLSLADGKSVRTVASSTPTPPLCPPPPLREHGLVCGRRRPWAIVYRTAALVRTRTRAHSASQRGTGSSLQHRHSAEECNAFPAQKRTALIPAMVPYSASEPAAQRPLVAPQHGLVSAQDLRLTRVLPHLDWACARGRRGGGP